MGLVTRFTELIDVQYKDPRGLLGIYIGEKMTRQHRPETSWTIKLLNLQVDEDILELGCGAGYAMKLLQKQSTVNQVVGLDRSKAVLQSATIRNRKEINKGNAQLIQGNVNQLPFQNEHFTKIFSIHSVYFWDDLPKTISEIHRVLKPGGTTVITLCEGKDGQTWEGIKSMIDEQLIPIMKQTGLKNVELKNGPDSRHFQTVAVIGEK
ncbi:class I SAM-dependent methyltransferase [Virgibacillus flavescens]|uniref:class I SAM-dependent methyltransferase n=1 Tax=Virgibacillus flavescens TaxID=1611422 RepID=UPI003D35273A